jgi:hypothetical protein
MPRSISPRSTCYRDGMKQHFVPRARSPGTPCTSRLATVLLPKPLLFCNMCWSGCDTSTRHTKPLYVTPSRKNLFSCTRSFGTVIALGRGRCHCSVAVTIFALHSVCAALRVHECAVPAVHARPYCRICSGCSTHACACIAHASGVSVLFDQACYRHGCSPRPLSLLSSRVML